MKNILATVAILLSFHVGYSQNDPSVSKNNYKHPNKAQYAREHNLDNSPSYSKEEVQSSNDYKHQFNKPTTSTEKVVVDTKAKQKNNKSYKHPYGL